MVNKQYTFEIGSAQVNPAIEEFLEVIKHAVKGIDLFPLYLNTQEPIGWRIVAKNQILAGMVAMEMIQCGIDYRVEVREVAG